MIFVSSKVSDGNMSLNSEDPKEASENRRKFFKKFCIKDVAEVSQIHNNNVVLVHEVISSDTVADGMITSNKGIYLLLKVADCIPIGFYDLKNQAIGIVHAGWRGLEKGIIKNTIDLMKESFDTNVKDLLINFGPSIGPCCYRMDLWKEAEDQLIDCGVLKKNIHNPRICTYESKDYFSHRRVVDQNLPDFRFVTILGLQNAN